MVNPSAFSTARHWLRLRRNGKTIGDGRSHVWIGALPRYRARALSGWTKSRASYNSWRGEAAPLLTPADEDETLRDAPPSGAVHLHPGAFGQHHAPVRRKHEHFSGPVRVAAPVAVLDSGPAAVRRPACDHVRGLDLELAVILASDEHGFAPRIDHPSTSCVPVERHL
jgi:hypothetical protein